MADGRALRTIVAGATGYSGRELVRLVANHPEMSLVGAFASTNAKADTN